MLTHAQLRILKIIIAYMKENEGVAPSFKELLELSGEASKSTIHRHLEGLEERGFIRRLKQRARAIEVLKQP